MSKVVDLVEYRYKQRSLKVSKILDTLDIQEEMPDQSIQSASLDEDRRKYLLAILLKEADQLDEGRGV
jgi:ATPase subunit of ABC transporter with duplicated ATPase domains